MTQNTKITDILCLHYLESWSVKVSTFSIGGACDDDDGNGTAPPSLPIRNSWIASSSLQLVAFSHNNQ